jgi:Domain of unknown function (DUF1848)
MKRIISVSRRTDVPAFYGDWFMGRLQEGFAGVVHPFGGRRYLVPLAPEDVTCFVFWSKNFSPFMENLKIIERLGYKFYFNYTVTGLPALFESRLDKHSAIENLKQLSRTYSPLHINWRFDPIIPSSLCSRDFFLKAFEALACEFEGYVERCVVSFVTEYGKVKRSFAEFERAAGVKIARCSRSFKIDLANELAAIAERHGMRMFSCCGDYLTAGPIQKARCIDGGVIERLFYPKGLEYKQKPTRSQCGCTESTDIGAYDTCPHGCIYCYANVNKHQAAQAYRNHDPASAFLGYSKSDSDRWLVELRQQMLW